jgi:hypothetical protein
MTLCLTEETWEWTTDDENICRIENFLTYKPQTTAKKFRVKLAKYQKCLKTEEACYKP